MKHLTVTNVINHFPELIIWKSKKRVIIWKKLVFLVCFAKKLLIIVSSVILITMSKTCPRTNMGRNCLLEFTILTRIIWFNKVASLFKIRHHYLLPIKRRGHSSNVTQKYGVIFLNTKQIFWVLKKFYHPSSIKYCDH